MNAPKPKLDIDTTRERLVAVLVRLSDESEIAPGHWFLEAGFGSLDSSSPPTFADLNTAQSWMDQRLTRAGRAASFSER